MSENKKAARPGVGEAASENNATTAQLTKIAPPAAAQVRYSRGVNRFDNKPAQREAPDFDAFAAAVLDDRADAKGKTYICAPFAEGLHSKPDEYPGEATWRQKHLAQPRAFLPFDFDGFDTPETFARVRDWLGHRFQGFAYTTASHTAEAPRCRVVLAQTRETDREEGIRLCEAVQAMIERDIGAGRVKFDTSVYKAEQPLFTPLHGAEVFRFDGPPVDVDAVLADAPPVDDWDSRPAPTAAERAAAIADEDPVLDTLNILGMVKRDMGGGKYAVQCPCSGEHTSESNDTSTVYYLPHFGGFKYGKFHCLHDHCKDRPQEQFIEALGLNPHDVWRQQAGSTGLPNALGALLEGQSWPEPMPLPKLPSVPAFPVDLLPEGLKHWIGDAADRAKFPPDFAAVAAMCALGSVIGRKLGIRLKRRDDWTEYANVWGGLIGPPSALKSPAMREALRPFKALQVAADEAHAKEKQDHAARLEEYRLRKDAAKKAAAKKLSKDPDAEIDLGDLMAQPEDPAPRTYWTSNVNEASLGVLLEQNPNGILIERDELSALLVSLEDERNADLRGMLLSGWSGKEGYRFDRIMRGVTLLPKFAVSLVGGIQPGPLSRYVRSAFSGDRADGLLQRFQLLVWPDPVEFKYIDRYPDKHAKVAAAALFERADTFAPDSIGEPDDFFGDDPPFIRLGDAAQGLFIEWYEHFMRERRAAETGGEVAPLAAHFGKYPGLVGKLALILHVADDPGARAVSEQTMRKALAWIEYLTPHARRVYHAVAHPETGAAELLLARLKRSELPQAFKAWELAKKGWHGLTDAKAVKDACRLLFEYGWLIEVAPGGATGGRPSDPVYAVSPAAGGGA